MHRPRPWHSMKGFGLKSSKQDPGEDSGWPLPSAPASVFCKICIIKFLFQNMSKKENNYINFKRNILK